ncbi:MAG: carbohydrate kinase family protein [Firmicutes bacterium]|nr:carbohydrate kinase family protein [Bacillota bacterium]
MQEQLDVLCIGMALVDSIIKGFDPEPVSASGYRAVSGSLNVGGEAVNAAMASAKLKMKTAIMCSLGEDQAGDMIIAALERCGVRTDRILRSAEHPTPVTTMFVRDDGTRKSITNQAHRYNFHPEHYAAQTADAKALLLGSLFRAPFDESEILNKLLKQAKQAGQLIFADTKLPNFRRLGMEDFSESWPLIDYLTPNEDEARFFSGKDDPEEMADVFLKYGVRNVVIKLGAKGCYFKNAKTSIRMPAFDIPAVDATGAGDNFLAGLASELLRGESIHEAIIFASACGAICTTAVGAGTALESREQVLQFLRDHSV